MGKANSQTNPKSTNNKFWQFRNLADDDQKAELLLYGDISERSWWEDAATPKRFADDLAALGDVKEITVYINSGGGDVFAAQAIGNMLERNAATVTAHIDGLCASAATIVACHAGRPSELPAGSRAEAHRRERRCFWWQHREPARWIEQQLPAYLYEFQRKHICLCTKLHHLRQHECRRSTFHYGRRLREVLRVCGTVRTRKEAHAVWHLITPQSPVTPGI